MARAVRTHSGGGEDPFWSLVPACPPMTLYWSRKRLLAMRLSLGAVALLAGLVLLQVQPCMAQTPGAAPTQDAQQIANQTVDKGKSLLDKVGDGVGGAAKGIGGAASDAGKGLGTAAGAFGRFVGEVASAIGTAALATWTGLGVG